MSYTTQPRVAVFTAQLSTPSYSVSFHLQAANQLTVNLAGSTMTGNGVDYSVELLGSPAGSAGATITPTLPWSGALIIYGSALRNQQSEFEDSQRFDTNRFETALDLVHMICEEQDRDLLRCLRLPIGDTQDGLLNATPAERAFRLFGFDGAGAPALVGELDLTGYAIVGAFDDGEAIVWDQAQGVFAPGSTVVGVADGDKGHITVSGSGSVWTIDDGVVSLAKIASAAKSGNDATLITGTPGSEGLPAIWNSAGDLVAGSNLGANAVGDVFQHWGETAPAGSLALDGSEIDRTTYADLFAFATGTSSGSTTSASAVITAIPSTEDMRVGMKVEADGVPLGAAIASIDSATQVTLDTNATATATGVALRVFKAGFGAGDGADTFDLPDMRGEFIRGWAGAGSVDAGRVLGSWQEDEFKSHVHSFGNAQNAGIGTGGAFPGSGNTGAAGGDETRPRNVSLLICIRYVAAQGGGGSSGGGSSHDEVTLAGQSYLSLSDQEITAALINLTSHVTGTLPVANGGTGATTAAGARAALGVDPAGTDNSDDVTLAGTPDYITISGQVITRGLIDLTSDITGNLPVSALNGGTDASGSTFWCGDGTWKAPTGGAHDAVTLASPNRYLSLSAQEITAALIDLTSHVTGTLPVANGGTGATTAAGARTALGVDPAGTDNSDDVTLAGTPDYITISGQVITRALINLASHVTGTLPVANGGTGVTSLAGLASALLADDAARNTLSQMETDTEGAASGNLSFDGNEDMWNITTAGNITLNAHTNMTAAKDGQPKVARITLGGTHTISLTAAEFALATDVTVPSGVSGDVIYLGMLYNHAQTRFDVTSAQIVEAA